MYQSMQSLGLLWLVFDTGLSLTNSTHLGYLSSHWSVPVIVSNVELFLFFSMLHYNLETARINFFEINSIK